jgi:hypothetical protein
MEVAMLKCNACTHRVWSKSDSTGHENMSESKGDQPCGSLRAVLAHISPQWMVNDDGATIG